MSNQKFAKILLGITVGCMALLCAIVPFVPFAEDRDCYVDLIYGLTVISLTSAVSLFIAVKCDKKNMLTATPQLPWNVLFWGAVIAGMSFGTMIFQTPPMSQMSQALRLFTVAVLACAVVLAGLLWLTTEPEKRKPGLVRVK